MLDVRILQEMVFFIINIAFGYTVIIYNIRRKVCFASKAIMPVNSMFRLR